jgi:hypothetical protein
VGIGVAGNVRARVAGNIVTGAATGVQQAALIDVVGNCNAWACPETMMPFAQVDSNTVTGGTVAGIRVNNADSLTIIGNTVTNLSTPSGAYFVPSEAFGGISTSGYLRSVVRIIGNVVKHIVGNGIVLNSSTDSTVVLDSNVVADIDTIGTSGIGGSGVYLVQGTTQVTRNLVTGARRDGLRLYDSNYDSLFVTGNNIQGNAPYGLNINGADRGTVPAPDNWWGDAKGPGGTFGSDSSVAGDSVSGGINFDPYRIALNDSAPTTVPAGVSRFLARARALPAVRPVRLAGRADAPMAARDRWLTPSTPATRPAAVNARAASGPMAERDAAADRARAERAAHRAQRLQQLRAQVEARERAQQAAHAPPRAARSQGVRP